MLNNNLNNNMNNNLNNKPGCCANVNGKSFELILIAVFTLGAIIIATNFILTRWYFKQSYLLFLVKLDLLPLMFSVYFLQLYYDVGEAMVLF